MAANSARSNATLRSTNWLFVYTTAISILGGAVLALAIFNLPHERVGLAVFASMVVVAELGSVELFRTSRNSSVSVSMIVSIAAILALGPLAGVLVELFGGIANAIAMNYLNHRNARPNLMAVFRRSAFNIGMFTLSTAAAGQVFLLAGGQPGNLLHISILIPLILTVATDTAVNLIILLGVISLQTHRNPVEIWNQDIKWSAPINMVGGAVGGVALAIAYQIAGILGASVFFLPIFALGYSFRMYANNMRVYVDRLELQKDELHDANIELLETLSAVIDAFDIYTFGHSKQVAVYASALSQKMGLSDADQERVFKAALVHDLGKIGVPDTILSKSGRLSDREYDIMRRHPTIGADILSRIKSFRDLVPLVRSHQEKYDGSGYPDGLVGEGIPIGARIITLADSLDAMLSDRTYRKKMEFRQVIEEVQRCTGNHFDPQVVRAFLQLSEEKGPEFFHNSAQTINREVLPEIIGTTPIGIQPFLKRGLIQINHP